MYTCEICNKSFERDIQLKGHSRIHTDKPKIPDIKCSCIYTRQILSAKNLQTYQSKLTRCKHCDKLIYWSKIFCDHSCAASYNNEHRVANGYIISDSHKDKISNSLIKYFDKNPRNRKSKRFEINDSTLYEKVYFRNCYHCSTMFSSRVMRKYCNDCGDLYKSIRTQYKFIFNVYHYPDLFDIGYINKVGWYSRGGNAGTWNPDGLSRDHKVSVTDAIKNGYDPYYIRHPVNCEIMTWVENNKKKTHSSMSYDDLVIKVEEYNMKLIQNKRKVPE